MSLQSQSHCCAGNDVCDNDENVEIKFARNY